MRLLAGLRQLFYPREFRILKPVWSQEVSELIDTLAGIRNAMDSITPRPQPASDVSAPSFLADVATGLWRLRQKMLEPGTDRPLEEMRRAYRHLESTWDALSDAGVQIQDHTGEPFHHGRSIKVVAYQPTGGLTREKVLETIRPSIHFRGSAIQMAEVIVGTPEAPVKDV